MHLVYAGFALSGLVKSNYRTDIIAVDAFRLADAMIAERKRRAEDG
jgi:hypothetical protein